MPEHTESECTPVRKFKPSPQPTASANSEEALQDYDRAMHNRHWSNAFPPHRGDSRYNNK